MKPPGRILISIVIPAFQEESRIGRLLSQFPPHFRKRHGVELIVSDGGSTDRTCELASEAADIVVVHQGVGPQTISGGRNRGADVARGELLCFLNADVTVGEPEQLLAAAREKFSDPGVIGATCNVFVDPLEETIFDRWFHFAFNRWCATVTLMGIGMGRGECQIVRAELFRKLGGYNEALAAAEDFDLFRRLGRRGRIAFLGGVTVFESPRRYRALGYPKVLSSWFMNALSVMFRGKSKSEKWEPIR